MATKEIGMLFNDEMVRAIIRGDKTQTRRPISCVDASFDERIIIKGHFFRTDGIYTPGDGSICQPYPFSKLPDFCPFKVGDRIWVREAYRVQEFSFAPDLWCKVQCRADGSERVIDGGRGALYFNTKNPRAWMPSIHMPRAFCRLELEIENIRAERVQEISLDDALWEGLGNGDAYETHTDEFKSVWDAIYAARGLGWDVNPWVWVIEFCKVNQKAQA